MESIKISISINELIDNEFISTVSGTVSLPSDPLCDIGNKPISFSNVGSQTTITKDVVIPILLTHEYRNIGYYNIIDCSGTTETTDGIWVTGETTDRLDEVKTYSGKFIVGNNFSHVPYYTGVIEKNGNIITYVINGKYDVNGYVEGTGVIYVTDTSKSYTYFMYNINSFESTEKEGCTFHKDHFTFKEVRPYVLENNAFIDRGTPVSVNENLFRLMEFQTTDDFFNNNIYKIF